MMPDTFNVTNRELILALAVRYGVPVVSNNPIFAKSGCLITYGVDFAELVRQAAGYIARILKVRAQPICQSKIRPNSISPSSSRPPRRWASTCRCISSRSPTR